MESTGFYCPFLHVLYSVYFLLLGGFELLSAADGNEIQRKTPMEFLVCLCPFGLLSMFIVFPVLYLLNPDLPVLLFSVVPHHRRNVWTIILCLSMETLCIAVFLTWCLYSFFIIFSFVTTTIDSTRSAIMKIK
jgi:hypothetical protein